VTAGTGPRAAVAGIGQTRYAKNMGRGELDLATEAITNACADAGLPVGAVDGFVSYHVEQVAEVDLVRALGLTDLRFMVRTPSGGGGAASILGLAAVAVSSGVAESVVAFRARNRTEMIPTRVAGRGRRPGPGCATSGSGSTRSGLPRLRTSSR
jgi:acetyl-CoA acetyltransferase